MTGALHRLLQSKETELATVRAQLKDLSNNHTHTLVILHERNRDVERLNNIVTVLRDQAISRDIELSSAQQALQASEADHDVAASKYQTRVQSLEREIRELSLQLEQEDMARRRMAKDNCIVVEKLRDEALQSQATLQQEEALLSKLRASEASLQDCCVSLQSQISSQEVTISGLQDRCTALQSTVNTQDAQSSALQERCNSLQSRLSKSEAEAAIVRQQLSNAVEGAKILQSEMQEIISTRDSQIADLRLQFRKQANSDALRQKEQEAQLETLIAKFNTMRQCSEQQANDIATLTEEREKLRTDKSQMRATITELTSALTSTQLDRDRALEVSRREATAHHSTQVQLASSQQRLHESVMRDHERKMLDVQPSPPALSPRAIDHPQTRCCSPGRNLTTAPSSVLDASRSALLRAQQTLDNFQSLSGPKPCAHGSSMASPRPYRGANALEPPKNISPRPYTSPRHNGPYSQQMRETAEDLALRAEAARWTGGKNSLYEPETRSSSPRALLSSRPQYQSSSTSQALAAAQAAQNVARASTTAAQMGSPRPPPIWPETSRTTALASPRYGTTLSRANIAPSSYLTGRQWR